MKLNFKTLVMHKNENPYICLLFYKTSTILDLSLSSTKKRMACEEGGCKKCCFKGAFGSINTKVTKVLPRLNQGKKNKIIKWTHGEKINDNVHIYIYIYI